MSSQWSRPTPPAWLHGVISSQWSRPTPAPPAWLWRCQASGVGLLPPAPAWLWRCQASGVGLLPQPDSMARFEACGVGLLPPAPAWLWRCQASGVGLLPQPDSMARFEACGVGLLLPTWLRQSQVIVVALRRSPTVAISSQWSRPTPAPPAWLWRCQASGVGLLPPPPDCGDFKPVE